MWILSGLGEKTDHGVPSGRIDSKMSLDIFYLPEKNRARSKFPCRRLGRKIGRQFAEGDLRNVAKDVQLEKFIFALGIRHVGEITAELLARHYGFRLPCGSRRWRNFPEGGEALAELDNDRRHRPESRGRNGRLFPRIAQCGNRENVIWWRNCCASGTRRRLPASSPVAGKTVVFTGSLAKLTRSRGFKARAEIAWVQKRWPVRCRPKPIMSLPEKTPVLKLKNAKELGVRILNEGANGSH